MQTAKPTLRSKGCLKNKFKELIQTLRNRTVLKEHISSSLANTHLPLQSQQYLQAHINSILPITQINKPHIQQFLSNDESSSDKSTEFLKNQIQDIKGMNEIQESLYEDNEDCEGEIEGSRFLVNQLTDLLRPEEKLALPRNEGRTGCIRRQRFSVNKTKREAKQPRYIKNPIKNHPTPTPEITPIRINIKDLDDVAVIKSWNNSKKITQNSTIQEIYETFSRLIQELYINLPDPMIKKYKNCVYFGDKPQSSPHTYEGIIYYFDNKMYYGQHYLGNKHGHGVEINFENNTKFAGNFNMGKKSGYFFVQRQRENYEGMIEHGIYQGEGKLMTYDYVYVGSFQNGKKHGYGEEYYPKTGLRLKGCFKNGEYQNMDKSKMVHDPTSQPQLKSKPEKVMTKSDAYDIDFQLQRTFKRQVQGFVSSSNTNPKEDLQRTDSLSLFDMLTNSSKSNKYDYTTSTFIQKLPKIRIQGVQTQFKEYNPQFSVEPVTNKRPFQLYNSRQSSPIARRSHSNHQYPASLIDRELPLTKHRQNFPIRSGK